MDAHDVALMAYCPLAQAGELQRGLVDHPVLNRIAAEHQATVLQLLLAFVLKRQHTIAIPRSGKSAYVEANAGALDIRFSEQELSEIDQAFPAPDHKTYLDIV